MNFSLGGNNIFQVGNQTEQLVISSNGALSFSDSAVGPEARVITGQAVERLKAARQDLPVTMRAAIELAYYEGLTQSAIAERLGEPLGTVNTRVRTALQKLRSSLGQEGTP